MKILVICCSPWRNDNNIGDTYSNIFSNFQDVEIANIFLKSGRPQNTVVKKYFQITEKSMISNILNNKPSGIEVNCNDADMFSQKETIIYDKLRLLRWQALFWGRELIWKIGKWQSPELKKFVEQFDPDIIFAPLQGTIYFNNILLYIKKITQKPLITYAWDDVYTLKKFSFSPFYWINKFLQRSKIRKVVAECEYLYVISYLQKKEYEKQLNKECTLLYKGYDFKNSHREIKEVNLPIRIVYTGNISGGRWKTLSKIGNELNIINKDNIKAQLFITSNSPVSKRIVAALNIKDNMYFMGNVSNIELEKIQEEADILLHVEPFGLKEKYTYRLSFSTKLVDYFYKRKCIIAVGKENLASIDYLIKNDAAITVTEIKEISNELKRVIDNPSLIVEYADKAWECGNRNHQIKDIQYKLYNDLKSLFDNRL